MTVIYKKWAMPESKFNDEDRRLIEEAVAAGKVTKVRPGAAQNDEMSRSTRELAAKDRKEFAKKKKDKSK
jgi:hypothetical protein